MSQARQSQLLAVSEEGAAQARNGLKPSHLHAARAYQVLATFFAESGCLSYQHVPNPYFQKFGTEQSKALIVGARSSELVDLSWSCTSRLTKAMPDMANYIMHVVLQELPK